MENPIFLERPLKKAIEHLQDASFHIQNSGILSLRQKKAVLDAIYGAQEAILRDKGQKQEGN